MMNFALLRKTLKITIKAAFFHQFIETGQTEKYPLYPKNFFEKNRNFSNSALATTVVVEIFALENWIWRLNDMFFDQG